jgi:hypothetical protein
MEEGRVASIDIPNPLSWMTIPPGHKGLTMVLGWGKWAKQHRDANARIKSGQIPVRNYRCPQCGYIEFNAKRITP